MRSGITPVIATVILLMMTVAIAGGAFFWISSLQSRAQQGVGTQASTTSTRTAFNAQMISLEINPEADYLNATVFNNNQRTIPSGAMAYTIINEQQEIIKTVVSELTSSIDYGEFKTLSVNIGEEVIGNKTYTVKVTFSDGTTAIGDTVAYDSSINSLCGNNVCNYYSGENIKNCPQDCSPKSVPFFLGPNLVAHDRVILNDNQIFYGNQSIIYTATGNNEEGCGITLGNKYFIIFSESINETDYYLKYTYYDTNSFTIVSNVYNDANKIYENSYYIYCSPPTVNNVIHLMFNNCTLTDCNLTYINWTETQGFSTPKVMTNSYDPGADNYISFSHNGNYGMAYWESSDQSYVNLTKYINGAWQAPEQVITSHSGWVRGAVNNEGEILMAYYNGSSDLSYYVFINETITFGELAEGTYKPKGNGIQTLNDGSFIITFESVSNQLYYKIFRNNMLTQLQPIPTAELGFTGRTISNDVTLFKIQFTGGLPYNASFNNVELTGALTKLADFSICGNSICEIGDLCSIDCATETYCNDLIDNDQDGNTDCLDTDCSLNPACS